VEVEVVVVVVKKKKGEVVTANLAVALRLLLPPLLCSPFSFSLSPSPRDFTAFTRNILI
jgi:hypothetical protein